MIADVRGMSVLVVGATRGIGRAIALRLHAQGARVGITGRDLSTARNVAREIGDRVSPNALDVRDRHAIETTIGDFMAQRGDALVYCAGISPNFTSAEKLDEADWDAILAVNLTGAFLCARAFARRAIERERPAAILFVGSIAGISGAGRLAAYSASKAGLSGLAKSLALDWARYRIRVNVLAPGWVETDMTQGIRKSEALSSWIESRTPQGRMALPEDVADLAVFLVSDSARFATGAVYPLDGGWTAG